MILQIFNLLAIFYAFRSLQIGRNVWQNWDALQDPVLNRPHKNLAEQASFYLAVPVGVFIHEGGHALAVWLFGGRVVTFGYRLFWGFVEPAGTFTLSEDWFISLAGTLGSLLFGLAVWLVLRSHRAPAIRYFGLRAFRFQIYFSLIYYPVFTLLGFYGDWRTIYDFQATPLLSGTTAVFHAASLGLFFWLDRQGWFQMAAFESGEEQARLAQVEQQAAANPQDMQARLQLIDSYRRQGLTRQAQQQLKQFIKDYPDSAEGHVQMAVLSAQGSRRISNQAHKSAEKALSMGLSEPKAAAYMHQILGLYSFDLGRLEQAQEHFSQGLALLKTADNPPQLAQLYFFQAMTYRRRSQYDQAAQAIQQAIDLAQAHGLEQALKSYEGELETIHHHTRR